MIPISSIKMLNLKNKYLTIIVYFIILIFCLLISYRDFLITLKLMMFSSYNFSMLPFDAYYKMNLLFDGRSNESAGYPWSSRHIANFFNYFIYKIVPCLEVGQIPKSISKDVYCSYWSLALSNFIHTALFQVSTFIYTTKILKRTMTEGVIVLFVSYFIISLSDRFGIDRFSILCISLFLFLANHKIFKYLFIFLSIFINEKITIFLAVYYFCKNFSKFINKEKVNYFTTIFSLTLFFSYSLYYLNFNLNFDLKNNSFSLIDYLDGSMVDRNFLSFHALANSLIPIFIIIFPFLFYFKNKKVLNEFRLGKIYILIPIAFIFLGWLIGGSGNAGRLAVYISPLLIPLYGLFLLNLIKKIKDLR